MKLKLVKDNFVDTSDEDVIEGTVVYMTDREAIIDINAKSFVFIENSQDLPASGMRPNIGTVYLIGTKDSRYTYPQMELKASS